MDNATVESVDILSTTDKKPAYSGIYNRVVKRVLDFVFAAIFFVILIPVYMVIAVLILADTGRPVLYKAERSGYRGKIVKMYKFRTMVKDAESRGGPTTALNDKRITKSGWFLRKTKLDESAQIINILKGEMSFVGPRPEMPRYTALYEGKEKLILKVRPGITDYSSLEFINLDEIVGHENVDEIYEQQILKKKNQLRVKYAETVSFKTDLNLFFRTIAQVIRKVTGILKK